SADLQRSAGNDVTGVAHVLGVDRHIAGAVAAAVSIYAGFDDGAVGQLPTGGQPDLITGGDVLLDVQRIAALQVHAGAIHRALNLGVQGLDADGAGRGRLGHVQ
nr:hypothetical protein [Tanacetum cinerariifolium]